MSIRFQRTHHTHTVNFTVAVWHFLTRTNSAPNAVSYISLHFRLHEPLASHSHARTHTRHGENRFITRATHSDWEGKFRVKAQNPRNDRPRIGALTNAPRFRTHTETHTKQRIGIILVRPRSSITFPLYRARCMLDRARVRQRQCVASLAHFALDEGQHAAKCEFTRARPIFRRTRLRRDTPVAE